MKPQILQQLAAIAPQIALSIHWEHDHAPDDEIFTEGWALHGEDPDDWQQWQSEVRASAVPLGRLVTGSAYLGGTWERAGDDPAESNPDISGYLPQMIDEALDDLLRQDVAGLVDQIHAAREHVTADMRRRYEEQRQAVDALASAALNT